MEQEQYCQHEEFLILIVKWKLLEVLQVSLHNLHGCIFSLLLLRSLPGLFLRLLFGRQKDVNLGSEEEKRGVLAFQCGDDDDPGNQDEEVEGDNLHPR